MICSEPRQSMGNLLNQRQRVVFIRKFIREKFHQFFRRQELQRKRIGLVVRWRAVFQHGRVSLLSFRPAAPFRLLARCCFSRFRLVELGIERWCCTATRGPNVFQNVWRNLELHNDTFYLGNSLKADYTCEAFSTQAASASRKNLSFRRSV